MPSTLIYHETYAGYSNGSKRKKQATLGKKGNTKAKVYV